MELMCLLKVSVLSNITTRILKESHKFREVLPMTDQGEEEI